MFWKWWAHHQFWNFSQAWPEDQKTGVQCTLSGVYQTRSFTQFQFALHSTPFMHLNFDLSYRCTNFYSVYVLSRKQYHTPGFRPLRVCTFLYNQIYSWRYQKFLGAWPPKNLHFSSLPVQSWRLIFLKFWKVSGISPPKTVPSYIATFVPGDKFNCNLKNFRGLRPQKSLCLPLSSPLFLGANFT